MPKNITQNLPHAEELRKLFDGMKPWFHNIVVDGIPTKTEPAWGEPIDATSNVWEPLAQRIDFKGKCVLDVGCNGGFYLVEASRAGASKCLGVEGDNHFARQAALVAELTSPNGIEVRNASAYDLGEDTGQFDITLLLGLIYHLKDPLRVVNRLARITSEVMVIETALRNSHVDLENRNARKRGLPEMTFVGPLDIETSDRAKIEGETVDPKVTYEGAPNWWMPNIECVEAIMWSSGFRNTEVIFEYLHEPGEKHFGRGMVIGRR